MDEDYNEFQELIMIYGDHSFRFTCNGCDAEIPVTPNSDGLWYEGTDLTCQKCGMVGWVSVDEDQAYRSIGDEHYADVGQPKCDGSCGAVKKWWKDEGPQPCAWTCERAKETVSMVLDNFERKA